MTEIVARLPRARGPLRLIVPLVLVLGTGLVAAGFLALRSPAKPHAGAHGIALRPLHVQIGRHETGAAAKAVQQTRVARGVSTALGDDAAQGVDRNVFTASPGGVLATAARVARWRPLVLRATRHSGIGPNMLEALVFVESSGYSAAAGGGRVGLTQLSVTTARRYLHLHVNVRRSAALTRRIDRADARGAHVTARQLRRWRARYDERYAPTKALGATVRYLEHARHALGGWDLAVAAYHLGIPSVRAAIRASDVEGVPTFAQLYFGSAPDRHGAVWRHVASPYYWKVLAAKRVMLLYRTDQSALLFEQRQQAQKNSAEEVLHPRYRTPRFSNPRAIVSAWKHHVLRAIPLNTRRTHIAIGPFFGDQAHKLGRSRRLYRGLRPATLDVLLYIGKRVHEISGTRAPLILTSALRDNRYQSVLMRVNANAARTYSIHTTGYAFDIARAYATRRQARAFQFVLDRLESVNAIAYIREAAAIHVAVASDAQRKLRLLAAAEG